MANTKIDRIKLNGSDTVYDIDLPPDATPSISSLTIANGLTGTGALVWNGNFVDTFKLNILSSDSAEEVFTYSQLSASLKCYSLTLKSTSGGSNMVLNPNTGGSISITGGSKDKYFSFASATDGTFLTTGDKGVANGVASLGSDGKVPASQLNISIPDTSTFLDKGTESTTATQTIYNPVEMKKGFTGEGVFTWSKTAYGETGTTQIVDGCRLLLTQGYNSPSIDFSTRGTETHVSSITSTSISFANDSTYASILWNSNITNMSDKPFFLTSNLLGKRNYIAQLDNTGKIPAAQLPGNYLDKGDRDSTTNQIIYNPVELKKPLVVPSIQSPKYTDKSGAQHSLFELGGTHSVNNGVSSGYGSLTLYRDRDGTWDSTSISYTLAEGLKIGDYGVGGPLSNNGYAIATKYLMTNKDRVITQDINGRVIVKAGSGVSSDDFIFESVYNGKLHSKMSVGPNGLVTGGWCIDDSKILTESNFSFDSATGTLTIN